MKRECFFNLPIAWLITAKIYRNDMKIIIIIFIIKTVSLLIPKIQLKGRKFIGGKRHFWIFTRWQKKCLHFSNSRRTKTLNLFNVTLVELINISQFYLSLVNRLFLIILQIWKKMYFHGSGKSRGGNSMLCLSFSDLR